MKCLLLAAALVCAAAPALALDYGAYAADNTPNVVTNRPNAYDRADRAYAWQRYQERYYPRYDRYAYEDRYGRSYWRRDWRDRTPDWDDD